MRKRLQALLDPEVQELYWNQESLTQNDEVGNANKMSAIKVGMDSDSFDSLKPGSEVGSFNRFTANRMHIQGMEEDCQFN